MSFNSGSVSPYLTFIKLPQHALHHRDNFKCTKADPCLLHDNSYKTGIQDSYEVQHIAAQFLLQVTHREQLWSHVTRLDCLTSRGAAPFSESGNTRTLMCKCSPECDKELNSNSYRFFYLGPELWLKLSCGICKIFSTCELTELFNNVRVSTVMSPSEQPEEVCFLSVAAYFTRRFSV